MAEPNRLRRKLSIAAWSAPREGNIHGKLTVDVTEALAWLEHATSETGEKVTMTHLVGAAVGRALAAEPSLNGTIRFGRFVPHDEVNVTFLVSMPDGSDLAKARIDHVDRRHPADVARELRERAERLRTGVDDDWEKSKAAIRLLPTWLLRRVVWLTGWLASSLGLDIPALGVQRFAFGSAVVTNVGMFGVDEAYVPPTPFARIPLWILVGAVREVPAVRDGAVVATSQMAIMVTIDHRFIDGFQAGTLAGVFRSVFEDPWQLDREPTGSAVAPTLDPAVPDLREEPA
jgi:pyruvate/2-oxoglutarate dehydrogenase complex dihydrolipoamide acyltransferase (E2) component